LDQKESALPRVSPSSFFCRLSVHHMRNEHSPVDHVEPMQMLECNEQLGRVEPTPLFVELALSLEMMEQLASVDEREDEVELFLGLERELKGDDEGVVDLGEYGSLGEGVDDLRTGDDVRLSDRLERVDSRGVALSDLHDLQKEQGAG
jgi:hypothetical protein